MTLHEKMSGTMNEQSNKYKVFISHSSIDIWVTRQIAKHIRTCKASIFLYTENIEIGENFENKIRRELRNSNEFLVLLTLWAVKREYIWAEIGVMWGLMLEEPEKELSSLQSLTSRLGNSTISRRPSGGLGERMCFPPRGNRISV